MSRFTSSIARSWSVTRRNWWRTFTPLLVIYLVVYLVSNIIVTPLLFISLAAMALVALPLEAALTGPLLGLALQLKAMDQEVRLCVPPDFREWIEGLGLAVTPIGLSDFI